MSAGTPSGLWRPRVSRHKSRGTVFPLGVDDGGPKAACMGLWLAVWGGYDGPEQTMVMPFLYEVLLNEVIPTYYEDQRRWQGMMRARCQRPAPFLLACWASTTICSICQQHCSGSEGNPAGHGGVLAEKVPHRRILSVAILEAKENGGTRCIRPIIPCCTNNCRPY